MPGKLCYGKKANNGPTLQLSKAFCEGVEYRAQGTAAAFPITDNPHESGSEAGDAWGQGWTTTEASAGGTVTPESAPCCAVPQHTILA